ncbi:DnaA regulatory inactivator HdaA [Chelativorans salis]|uniref:DnaA regulatory inactivator HdaA n=1 Tax=Chelativorans salis TaxID=2978478 RepID=A0ABT2LNN7_9HYPH|nr:DnaA regulatory inactivator HdaA [Chelativorans sp. EGI FJ00035]MCT7375901.1 DnaA regulatory inactivator HdaA [Chelativorans sp. EGI FJ00035]
MTPSGPPPRQLPLDLAHEEARTRDDLVVTPANARAVALVESWPDWPSSVTVLAGPAGAGKSHLAAIWRAHSGARQVAADRIDGATLAAAEHGPVLVDDADSAARDETALFHLINTVRGADTHLLLTARRFPTGWGVRLPDLLSRLKAAALVEIDEPDDVLLAGVIVKLFADRQVAVEPHVVQFLVRRIERSLSTAQQVVERLDRAALERKTRITRALAADVVGAMETG